jgi:ADP-heptose:LPS heptosyltransferase/GT2 family glycosyltransferase
MKNLAYHHLHAPSNPTWLGNQAKAQQQKLINANRELDRLKILSSSIQKFVKHNEDASLDLETIEWMGDLCFTLEKYDQARDLYERAVKIDPSNLSILSRLGIVYFRSGEDQLARETFCKCLVVNPDHPVSKQNIELLDTIQHRNVKSWMNIDAAQINRDTIRVNGWAICLDEIASIQVFYDGKSIGQAIYGYPRLDVGSVFPLLPGSEFSGFSLDQYIEEGSEYGTHIVKVEVNTKNGLAIRQEKEFVYTDTSFSHYQSRIKPGLSALYWMRAVSNHYAFRPTIGLVIYLDRNDLDAFRITLSSIKDQAYPFWHLFIHCPDDVKAGVISILQKQLDSQDWSLFTRLGQIQPCEEIEYILVLPPGDRILSQTLFSWVGELNEKQVDVLYGDEEWTDLNLPVFKPGWSPNLLANVNYIGHSALIKRTLLSSLHSDTPLRTKEDIYNFFLSLLDQPLQISHVPGIGIKSEYTRWFLDPHKSANCISRYIQRRKLPAQVERTTVSPATSIRFKNSTLPSISLIVPVVQLSDPEVKSLVDHLESNTSYPDLEIILITADIHALDAWKQNRKLEQVQVDPGFSTVASINRAIEKANGDAVIIFDPDLRIDDPKWLEKIMGEIDFSSSGIVGIGMTGSENIRNTVYAIAADPPFYKKISFPKEIDHPYYSTLRDSIQNTSLVDFSCVLIRKDIFTSLGELDPEFSLFYTGFDYCLRAREKNYPVIDLPGNFVKGIAKNRSGIEEKSSIEENRFFIKWKFFLSEDPYFSNYFPDLSSNHMMTDDIVYIEHHGGILTDSISLSKRTKNRIDQSESPNIQRILTVKLDHIGDVILSLPALKMLRAKFPTARITALVGHWAKTIIEDSGLVDEVLVYDFFDEKSENGVRIASRDELVQLTGCLLERHFDLAIDFRRHPETRSILKISGAKFTIGYEVPDHQADWLSFALEMSPEITDIQLQTYKPHISAQMADLVKAIPFGLPITSRLVPSDQLQPAPVIPQKYVSEIPAGKLIVGIHPGAGTCARQWPAEQFSRLCDLLIERNNAFILLFGGKSEIDLADRVQSGMIHQKQVISLAGKCNLREFSNLVTCCDLYIGNNSGPTHIAGIREVPTISIFSGHILPHEWHPLGDNTLSVQLDMPCSPCYLPATEGACPFDLECLVRLTPEKIWESANKLLRAKITATDMQKAEVEIAEVTYLHDPDIDSDLENQVDIIVPIYGQPGLVKQCIDSVLSTTGCQNIILVDDCSPGNEITALLNQYQNNPRISVVRTPKNQGFIEATTLGTTIGNAPFLLFLNSDIEAIDKGWLGKMIPTEKKIAIVGAKLLFPMETPGPLAGTIQHAGVARNEHGVPYHPFLGQPSSHPQANILRKIDAVTGGCFLIRRKIWKEFKGWDSEFGRGVYEDVDLCWRVRQKGYEILYQPQACLYHGSSASKSENGQHSLYIHKEKNLEHLLDRWGRSGSDEVLFYGEATLQRWKSAKEELSKIQIGKSADRNQLAIKKIQEILHKAPDMDQGYIVLAQLHCAAGDHSAAVRDYEKAISLSPTDWKLRLLLIDELVFSNQIDRAEQILSQLEAMFPDSPDITTRKTAIGNIRKETVKINPKKSPENIYKELLESDNIVEALSKYEADLSPDLVQLIVQDAHAARENDEVDLAEGLESLVDIILQMIEKQ